MDSKHRASPPICDHFLAITRPTGFFNDPLDGESITIRGPQVKALHFGVAVLQRGVQSFFLVLGAP
ncbi:MAG: hypothetical protein ACOVNV_03940 [Pirellulaceae bacterium]